MELPPSLYGFMEQTGLPENEALPEWEAALVAYQGFIKAQKAASPPTFEWPWQEQIDRQKK